MLQKQSPLIFRVTNKLEKHLVIAHEILNVFEGLAIAVLVCISQNEASRAALCFCQGALVIPRTLDVYSHIGLLQLLGCVMLLCVYTFAQALPCV